MNKMTQQSKALPLFTKQNNVIQDLIKQMRPAKPLYVIFQDVIEQTAREFVNAFPGKALFAVKTNPDLQVLSALRKGGVTGFDVASLSEIRQVRQICPHAELHFMHPVKMPEEIRSAYCDYGVKHFVLDHEDELFKIMRETELAQDLNLTVRIALPKNDSALIDFSSKFGAGFYDAVELLRKCRPVSQVLGLSFHVGTQTTDAEQYAKAIDYCARLIEESGIEVDSLNIGGGFPVAYEGDENLFTIHQCFDGIRDALARNGLSGIQLLSEPGRVLVAKGANLVARVELRKGDILYINDGVYGGLFDAAKWIGTNYPVSAVTSDRAFDGPVQSFSLAGPTCDSIDMMEGPFVLPTDIGMGDWIIFDNVGAYSQALRSDFNGFGYADVVCAYKDRPQE